MQDSIHHPEQSAKHPLIPVLIAVLSHPFMLCHENDPTQVAVLAGSIFANVCATSLNCVAKTCAQRCIREADSIRYIVRFAANGFSSVTLSLDKWDLPIIESRAE